MLSLKYVDRRLVLVVLAALAVELWVLFSDVHFLWRPPRALPDAVRVAQVLSVGNQGLVRSPLQLNWVAMHAGQPLFEGDEVATVGDSSATLKFLDGQTVTLGADSLLVLKSARLLSRRSFELTLLQGSLRQEGDRASARTQLEIEVGGQKVISSGAASFRLESRAAGGPSIDLAKGQVQVTDLSGKPLAPTPGAAGHPLAGGAGPDRVATPVPLQPARLLAPAAGEVIVNPREVRLSWGSRDGIAASVTVEVSPSPGFEGEVTRMELAREARGEGSVAFRPGHKGRYYWRVVREDSGHRQASEATSFEVLRRLAAPELERPRIRKSPGLTRPAIDAPQLRRPIIHYSRERGALLTHALDLAWSALDFLLGADAGAAEVERAPAAAQAPGAEDGSSAYTVDLDWEPVPGARAYALQIATDPRFEHLSAEKVLTEPRFSWHTDEAGFFYWRVAGIDEDGDRGPFSEFMTFTIKAERNRLGDETSYETYLRFDEYSRYQQSLSLYFGPEWTNYYFSSTDRFSPDSVIYHKKTLVNGALDYDYRLNPYYSAQFAFRADKSVLSAEDYESRPTQQTLKQYETVFALGIERRFFEPTHYYTLQAGVRVSYIDMPVLGPGGDLVYDSFGFFGFYLIGGIHWTLWKDLEAALRLGAVYQHTGDSFRVTQLGGLELRKPILEWMFCGLAFDELLAAYRFDSDNVVGQAHSLSLRPMLFIGVSF